MKQTMSKSNFIDAFKMSDSRRDQFSYDALELLFDYFEQYEDDTGEEIEFDMVAICCEYEETHYTDVISNYSDNFDSESDIGDVVYYLQDNTLYVGKTDNDCLVFASF